MVLEMIDFVDDSPLCRHKKATYVFISEKYPTRHIGSQLPPQCCYNMSGYRGSSTSVVEDDISYTRGRILEFSSSANKPLVSSKMKILSPSVRKHVVKW